MSYINISLAEIKELIADCKINVSGLILVRFHEICSLNIESILMIRTNTSI